MKVKVTRDEKGFETFYEKKDCATIKSISIKHKKVPEKLSIEEIAARFHSGHYANTKDEPCLIECNFRDGTINSFEFPKDNVVYSSQFGISVTQDGKFLFMQTWEDGLFCHETRTGKLHWKSPIKKVRQICLKDNVIVCNVDFEKTVTLSINDGKRI